ncbi:sugar ABC superfamily ATP binding cassette transporter, sugar-binding protein [Amylolactobacillus amylotrophicus DSM 20534]|uniref:Sugar ABC superfamily ATP binding cassette transporter, sugar-binding protein n=3 Tax=Amylolactobacillus TaxID=2767876 RepID=A0A0R1YUS1_9LACO|nr:MULTISPECIES: extracellular solute-binding protein [Amylolactobacillus]APT18554.1 sugar ABC transporter substrate-binding protein [Amylolactobacillus amylophilus DSM 20533 = JCM 1125]KRK37620.1 sugar ABC superfamily ATP binding cassette transporter, sugar-binding protein [Amylolactobacillus amylotrophicus DSM 20534]KRM43595.1 sugar ABC superfamily ATP binding cassette transporter, sugar-binding protein [Amylolactobacillus amylophilus DSM 20533 = JCM 1125]GED80312.1 sugar ABC transporter subs
MQKWFKMALGGLALTAVAVSLTACSSGSSSSSDTKTSSKPSGKVTLWVDTNFTKVYGNIVDDFEKANPDVKVTVKQGNSADAQKDIKKDPSSAADVFMFPHDQIGQMADAGIIYQNTKYAKDVKANNIESAVDAATYKGKLYGYPYGVESQILYYNKSKLSADDVKTWSSLTSKGKIGTNFAENGANYIFSTLFMSNGDQLYGEHGETLDGTNFNNEKGVQVLQWISDQKKNSGVIQANASALSNLQSGKTDAYLSGPWSRNDVKKALGDNMAAAPYPTVDFGDGEKQFKAYLGVKLFGVNAETKNPVAAMALANYITSKKAQLAVFKDQGTVPSNAKAQESSDVTDDEVANAVLQMSQPTHSVVMPKIPEMVNFWPPMDAVINDAYKGKIASSDFQSKLDAFVKQVSKSSNK